ncbi:uncharacterized protein BO97DRAFT_374549 [Aspergillus homomorphus CBS 101889]|uniref:CCZ1/INTU/HSP4 first Longin domain-containing protein n=1 Tax=Aspergillus homomorphus (strain CBS 101889) TaxID=1450537 RepID=A0A395HNG1_ASPHC|nr:hypothetical protein BO97DRAFT_374549 [Aspergillus homomorphus CBS 101889]RAL09492.1 hypothetical protein BO97DRAFT_374549 [Aspergillus homomorphus CBS 101889]
MSDNVSASVTPAQLSFLTIYNPRLGPTDETIQNQIVFYTSRAEHSRQRDGQLSETGAKESSDEWNDRLRQIGLAQGIVGFARNFSEGRAVDYVDTEKSQIILHELEQDWWILASVDLTRLPVDWATSSQRAASATSSFAYSSREMCPPQLLIQQMRRAHAIFLLHHQFTLDALYDHVGRSTFCNILDSFWWRFAWSWEMLLTGNPLVDMYDGIKLSAGGELGVGVGEEEWGSGEREVLEDFVARTDGLLDLVVSRFGDSCPSSRGSTLEDREGESQSKNYDANLWLGAGVASKPSDGVIFTGVGALSRHSVVRVSQWMEWIYRYGVDAYGVGDDPTAPRRRKRRKKHRPRLPDGRGSSSKEVFVAHSQETATPDRPFSPGIPRPLVIGTPESSQLPTEFNMKTNSITSSESSSARSERGSDWMMPGTETFMKYLTLGYGSSWGPSSKTTTPHPRVGVLRQEVGSSASKPTKSPTDAEESSKGDHVDVDDKDKIQNRASFLIGFHRETSTSTSDSQTHDYIEAENPSTAESSHKIDQRTLHVQLTVPFEEAIPLDETPTGSVKLRTVVYVHQPFICTFLFDPSTPSLAQLSFYRELHSQLSILQKSLCNSTSPATASKRIAMSDSAFDANTPQSQQVYNFVYDSTNLTIRSSIPNIPELGVPSSIEAQDGAISQPWSRVESLNIHHRLLSTYSETRSRPLEVERTCKTSRGWWIVWMRMSDDPTSQPEKEGTPTTETSTGTPAEANISTGAGDAGGAQQEAFLIRRSSDHVPPSGHVRSGSGSRFFRDLGGASSPGLQAARTDTGPAKLVEGLGLDARRYIGNLLSLNR